MKRALEEVFFFSAYGAWPVSRRSMNPGTETVNSGSS